MVKGVTAGIDTLARSMASNIGDAMGGCLQSTAQFQQFIADSFVSHNVVSAPTSRTIAFATAYQALDPTKPAMVKIVVDLTLSIAIGSAANTCELVQGSTTAVASGTGVLGDTYRQDLSVTLITINFEGRGTVWALLPVGHYFALRRTAGSGISIVQCTDQSFG